MSPIRPSLLDRFYNMGDRIQSVLCNLETLKELKFWEQSLWDFKLTEGESARRYYCTQEIEKRDKFSANVHNLGQGSKKLKLKLPQRKS